MANGQSPTDEDKNTVAENMPEDMAVESAAVPAESNDIAEDETDRMPFTGGSSNLTVVGVGASAGGLEALQAMVSNLPEDIGLCFIVAQHLSPSYRSMMVDLLEKDSTLPVKAAVDGEKLYRNQVYVCPPNHNIELGKNDTIKLTVYPEVRHTPRPSVDMLFESIALEKGENGIGIVLSGTGSDGSRGIRAIKAENGFGIVQDPETAKYDGMPNSAINSGKVDLIIAPKNIGQELVNLLSFPRVLINGNEPVIAKEVYDAIIHQLKVHCDVDFRLYKENTILRRIERRMAALKIGSPDDYLAHMKSNSEEVSFLFNDMLIGVTSFFRDARAFELLRAELARYIQEKEQKTLRIWSVGCSTGEEAYSIAMVVADILGDKLSEWKVQIFATDIDKRSISYARNGIYPEVALANLPKEMRENNFSVVSDQFEVNKAIKSMLIFSTHDVNRDPPFLRLDLICCRNLIIYFTMELQRQIMPTFHYALNPRGLLMLGQSESIGIFQEQFRPLSKTGKIYEAVYVGKKLPPERGTRRKPLVSLSDLEQEDSEFRRTLAGSSDEMYFEVIEKTLRGILLPNAIVINDNYDIVFTEGDNPLLVRPEGKPSNNIYKNIHPSLSVDVRSALHELETGSDLTDTGYINIEVKGDKVWVKLILARAIRPRPIGSLTIICSQIEPIDKMPLKQGDGEAATEAAVVEQQRLLARTKEQLQNVIEELEASNEEMQSMNEELQSSNEELQSSNEELETTNEELQSTNEELQTAYSELRVAYEDKEQQQRELLKLRADLEQSNSLLEEAERIGRTGSWLWDVNSRKFEWSRGCYRMFGLDDNVFHPSYEAFIGVAHPDDRNRLETHMRNLLANKGSQPFVFKAQDSDRNAITISMEAVVSFNELKQAVRVMGSITDITEKMSYERASVLNKDKINYILNSSLNATYIYDVDLEIVEFFNSVFADVTGFGDDDVKRLKGGKFFELFAEKDREAVKASIEKIKGSQAGETIASQYRMVRKDGKDFEVYANHTIFEFDEMSGAAEKILINFFTSKHMS